MSFLQVDGDVLLAASGPLASRLACGTLSKQRGLYYISETCSYPVVMLQRIFHADAITFVFAACA